jgi:carotenoid cleavage dioxygenase-like enzyme
VIGLLEVEKLRGDVVLPQTSLRRYRIKLDGSGVVREDLAEGISPELPRINYRRNNTRDYRWMYAASTRESADWFDSLVKVDVTTRSVKTWAEPGCYPGEPVFVDRPGATTEDDGVVMSVVLDASGERSFLLFLDAASFTEVARAEAPHHIPFGFHGQYFRDKP